MMRFILPFVVFIILSAFLYVGLGLNPHEVPSPLIGKPAPAFSLPQLQEPEKLFTPEQMKGKVWLLNFWASWCSGCKDEHHTLLALARLNIVPIYGMDYKDKPDAGQEVLSSTGNPYTMVLSDAEGRTGIDYGVYGVPETYLIDKQGVIRYKQIGGVTEQAWAEKILPLIKELQSK
jgi:cytochrome c biogenesis protein CcmG, thiol:disulfide interchange protein DsbE